MKKLKIKTYIIPKQLRKIWKKNEVVYTIDCYTLGKIWSDSTMTQALLVGMSHKEYTDLMGERFNCIEFDYKLFFPTKSKCKEAIEFVDSLFILRKLL